MSRSKIDRKTLISKAAELFKVRGYHNTSMNDIALACDLRKASLYHHIPSRKALVIKVVEVALEQFQQEHFSMVYDQNLAAKERLTLMAKNLEQYFLVSGNGCLIRNLAIEIADTIPEIRELAILYYSTWVKAIFHLLSQKYKEEQSRELAEEVVSQLHGAILLMDVCKKDEYLKRAINRLASLLD